MKRSASVAASSAGCILKSRNNAATYCVNATNHKGDKDKGKVVNCLFCKELYGPNNTLIETEAFIMRKVQEVEREVDKLSNEELKKAYFTAIEQEIKQNITYVRSVKFVLIFLRKENFDAPKAALRMTKILEYKLNLFGPEKLPHRITQDDLDENDKLVLVSGVPLILGKDCGGRIVIFGNAANLEAKGVFTEYYKKNLLRAIFYTFMHAIEYDEQAAQFNGFVGIRWFVNYTTPLKKFRILTRPLNNFMAVMPIKCRSVHDCGNNIIASTCLSYSQIFFRKENVKKHSVTHGPTIQDCLSGLAKYGIDPNSLTVTSSGVLKTQYVQSIIDRMRQVELLSSNTINGKLEISSSEVTAQQTIIHNPSRSLHQSTNVRSSPQQCKEEEKEMNLHEKNQNHPDSISSAEQQQNEYEQKLSLVSTNANVAKKKTGGGISLSQNFLPAKLMNILNSNQYPNALWWSNNGDTFIMNEKLFLETVLITEFGEIKFGSFLRRLKRWGFQRVPSSKVKGGTTSSVNQGCVEYKHDLFLQRSPELLKDFNSKKDRFPIRLMKVIENQDKNSGSIWWVHNGKAFAFHKKKFACNILQECFDGIQLDSFCRMLKRWGFEKLQNLDNNNNVLIFRHGMFQKDLPMSLDIVEHWNTIEGLTQLCSSSDGGCSSNSNSKKKETFEMKLKRIMKNDKYQHAIWLVKADNKNLIAIDKNNFIQDVLPKEYNEIKFSSFYRTLQRWGFQKIKSDGPVSFYEDPSFRKNDLPIMAAAEHDDVSSVEETTQATRKKQELIDNRRKPKAEKATTTTTYSQNVVSDCHPLCGTSIMDNDDDCKKENFNRVGSKSSDVQKPIAESNKIPPEVRQHDVTSCPYVQQQNSNSPTIRSTTATTQSQQHYGLPQDANLQCNDHPSIVGLQQVTNLIRIRQDLACLQNQQILMHLQQLKQQQQHYNINTNMSQSLNRQQQEQHVPTTTDPTNNIQLIQQQYNGLQNMMLTQLALQQEQAALRLGCATTAPVIASLDNHHITAAQQAEAAYFQSIQHSNMLLQQSQQSQTSAAAPNLNPQEPGC